MTTNNFLAGGGDGFTLFKGGLNQVVDAADIDVLVSYIQSLQQRFQRGRRRSDRADRSS